MTNKNHEVEIKRLHSIDLNECSEFDRCLTECAKEVRSNLQSNLKKRKTLAKIEKRLNMKI